MLKYIWHIVAAAFWQGIGLEVSFFMLWVIWHGLHSRIAHKFDPEHLFHRVHDYFSK